MNRTKPRAASKPITKMPSATAPLRRVSTSKKSKRPDHSTGNALFQKNVYVDEIFFTISGHAV